MRFTSLILVQNYMDTYPYVPQPSHTFHSKLGPTSSIGLGAGDKPLHFGGFWSCAPMAASVLNAIVRYSPRPMQVPGCVYSVMNSQIN